MVHGTAKLPMFNLVNILTKKCNFRLNKHNFAVLFFFQDGDPHTNHFYIGFWVLTGIVGFLTLEKLFGENEEETPPKKEEIIKDKVKNSWYTIL